MKNVSYLLFVNECFKGFMTIGIDIPAEEMAGIEEEFRSKTFADGMCELKKKGRLKYVIKILAIFQYYLIIINIIYDILI